MSHLYWPASISEERKGYSSPSLADKTDSMLHLGTSSCRMHARGFRSGMNTQSSVSGQGNKSTHLGVLNRNHTRCPHSCSRESCILPLLSVQDRHTWSGHTHNILDTWCSTPLLDSFHWSPYTLQKKYNKGWGKRCVTEWSLTEQYPFNCRPNYTLWERLVRIVNCFLS